MVPLEEIASAETSEELARRQHQNAILRTAGPGLQTDDDALADARVIPGEFAESPEMVGRDPWRCLGFDRELNKPRPAIVRATINAPASPSGGFPNRRRQASVY